MPAKNKEIVEKVNKAFAENRVEGWLEFCSDDVLWTIVGAKSVKGKEAIRAWMASIDIEPPEFTVASLIAEGDNVVAHGNMIMKEKDGMTTPYSYCDVYQFRNGRIVELLSFVVKTEAKQEAKTA